MNILVCVKFVPDLENMTFAPIPPSKAETWDWEAATGRMNRYDEYAVEAALQWRERWGASRIDAASVGPPKVDEVLRRALGMGVDHGVHLQQAYQAFPSPFAIGGRIAAYARGKTYDLILCGAMSEDLMQGQVGPVIAALLDRPCLTSVHALGYSAKTGRLRCEREVEGGRHEVLEIEPPAVVTIQSGGQPPRYPALSKLLRANNYPLEVQAASVRGGDEDRQHVLATRTPVKPREGVLLSGTGEEKAQALAACLRKRGRI